MNNFCSCRCIIVAELSGNHHRDYKTAERLVKEAKNAGADAVKTQCFAPDDITLDVDFPITWNGQGTTLYKLYSEIAMPLEWHKPLRDLAESLGLQYFASVFSKRTVDLMVSLGVPYLKISSFELTDLSLIKYAAQTKIPLILSTGMASDSDLIEAMAAAGSLNKQNWLLHCVSQYPTPPEEYNLGRLKDLKDYWWYRVGLSDHTLGITIPISAVTLGASMVEKHLCLSRSQGGPDSTFSSEPQEFAEMVSTIRTVEKAVSVSSASSEPNAAYRRSLYVAENIQSGEEFTENNVRSIRPSGGLRPRYLKEILGKQAKRLCIKGEPLAWDMIS